MGLAILLFISLRISLRRLGQNYRMTLAAAFGIVISVAIVSSAVVYFEALRDVALSRALAPVPPSKLDVIIKVEQTPVGIDEDLVIKQTVEDFVVGPLSRYSSTSYLALQSRTFLVDEPPILVPLGACPCRPAGIASGPEDVPGRGADGQPDPRSVDSLISCDCRRVSFITIPGMENTIRITAGRMPVITDAPSSATEVMEIEALLDAEAAQAFGLKVGDMLPLGPFWDSPRERVEVKLSGIYERVDPGAPQWTVFDTEFVDRTETLSFARFVLPIETFIGALGPYFPVMSAEYVWLMDTDTDSIHATDTGTVLGAIQSSRAALQPNIDGFRIVTELDRRLADFEVHLFFNRIPMLILLALVAAVSLYYAGMVASALIATQQPEIALMRSRGATRLQIFCVYVIEASSVALAALIIGPLVSMFIVSMIGILPIFADLNAGEALPVQLTRNVLLMAGIGALFGLLALLVPAYRSTGLTVLSERRGRGRPGRLNVIQRYYLDLGLLGVVGLMFRQLSRQGSFVTTDVFGENSVNNLTLAVPALLMVMAGIAMLRLFPVVADIVSKVLGTRYGSLLVPSAAFLSVRQLARNPSGQARLLLLLVMVSALGVFAATFASTLERSAREQVLYRTGAEFRSTGVTYRGNGRSVSAEEQLNFIEGLDTVSPVLRTTGLADSLTAIESERFDVLAVDTGNLADVAWYRPDFWGESLSSLLDDIRPESPPGIPLFDDTRFISARVKTLVRRPDVLVVARLSDANGRYYSVPLGNLAPSATDRNRFNCLPPNPGIEPDWCRLGSSIFPPPTQRVGTIAPKMPVTMHSIGLVSPGGPLSAGSILIDDIEVLNNIGENPVVIEDFNDLSHFRTLEPTADSLADALTFVRDEYGESYPGVADFRWTDASPGEYRGFAFEANEPALPAIVSESFAVTHSAAVGDVVTTSVENTRVRFKVVRVISSFPTLNDDKVPFLVVDLDLLKARVNLGRISNDVQPDEFWVDTEPFENEGEVTAADIKEKLGGKLGGNSLTLTSSAVVDQKAELASVNLDPLVTTGWQALLTISFAAVLAVSAVGYAVHARTSFINRRTEMALLRTIGISRLQVVLFIAIEQVIVVGIAVFIGAFLGSRLGDTIFPFLAASGASATVSPPMIVEFQVAELGLVFGVMAVVILSVMAVVIWSASRTTIHAVMRAGDG
jgi:ABC-type antimicrobial peptide transport system permease subunit